MGVRILEGVKINEGRPGDEPTAAALYCSTTGMALQCPLFVDGEEAEAFIQWLIPDARQLSAEALAYKVRLFRALPPTVETEDEEVEA